MTVNPEQLDQESDSELAALLEPVEPPEAGETASTPPPAPQITPPETDWQAKYEAETERSRNAQALMTQATSELNSLRDEMAELKAGIERDRQQATPPAPEDPYRNLREEYEDFLPVFDELSAARREIAELRQQQAQQGQSFEQQRQQNAHEAFMAEVRKAHPDVDTIADSPDFRGWLTRQREGVQQMAQVSTDGAIYVITLYKQQTGIGSKDKLAAAAQVQEPRVPASHSRPNTAARGPTLEELARLPQSDYDKDDGKIDRMFSQIMRQGG